MEIRGLIPATVTPFAGDGSIDFRSLSEHVARVGSATGLYGVCVNGIAPGAFLTNIAGGRLKREPEVRKQFEAMAPMGRIASTDEMKGLALLLASPIEPPGAASPDEQARAQGETAQPAKTGEARP